MRFKGDYLIRIKPKTKKAAGICSLVDPVGIEPTTL